MQLHSSSDKPKSQRKPHHDPQSLPQHLDQYISNLKNRRKAIEMNVKRFFLPGELDL